MILHIDMDAFFASVEERENPALQGRPVVVGGSPKARGVVAAANYAAREFGVHSAMPSARALRLCPDLVIVKPRGALYAEVSRQVRGIFRQYTPQIEPLSLDEAFLDVQGSEMLYGSAEQIGRVIKTRILEQLGLVASVGVAPNKLLAKLASDQDKPDGFFIVHPDQVQEFLDPLPVSRIWGVGKASEQRLAAAKIYTVKNLRQMPEEWLIKEFGKNGQRLWQLSRGQDNRPVITESEARSISHETTFDHDLASLAGLEAVALSLTESVCFRLREGGLHARTIQLKVRYRDFSTVTRSKSLDRATDGTSTIWHWVKQMLHELLPGKDFAVRLIGVGVSNFCQSAEQAPQADLLDLADANEPHTGRDERQKRLDQLADRVRVRYGKGSLRRGKSIRGHE